MRIMILGRGPLAEPLAQLAERAGQTVSWVQEVGAPSGTDGAPDLVILAGSTTAVETVLKSVASAMAKDVIVVDATIPTQREHTKGEAEPEPSGTDWIAPILPRARVVRAFASVPAEALVAVLNRSTSGSLAVPLAGDDRQAKAQVGQFMRDIGVEPFDLGALRSRDALDPGGALWGKALGPVEMLEAVGWLSGDG